MQKFTSLFLSSFLVGSFLILVNFAGAESVNISANVKIELADNNKEC